MPNGSTRFAVGVSSQVLFDFSGEDETRAAERQQESASVGARAGSLPPGRALPLVKALLRLAGSTSLRFELVVLSPASADASPRLFASLHEHGLHATRAAFTGGEAFGAYLQAFGVDLLLSANNGEVSQAVASGTLAALVTASLVDAHRPIDQIRLAFDGDAAVFAQVRRADQGAEGTWLTSVEKPLASLMKLLSEIQTREPVTRQVRTALITRSASPAEQPVLKALREANVRLDEAYFGTDLPHQELLEVFRAHLLFAGAESPHFRISEEVAKADLHAMEEEARASETAWARLRERAGYRDSSTAADDSPSARK